MMDKILTGTLLDACNKQYSLNNPHTYEAQNRLVINQSFYDLLQSEGYDMTHYRVNKPLI
jgi:hypothetical protein